MPTGVRIRPVGARTFRVHGPLSREYRLVRGKWTEVTNATDLEFLLNHMGPVMEEERELGFRYMRFVGELPTSVPIAGELTSEVFMPGQAVIADGVTYRSIRRDGRFRPIPAAEVLGQFPSLRALAVRTLGLGDVLLTLPALATLKRRFPASRLHYSTAPELVRLFQGNPDVVEAHDTFSAYSAAPFGMVIDLGFWAESAPGRESIHRADIFAQAFGLEGVDDYRMRYIVQPEEREEAASRLPEGRPCVAVSVRGSIPRRTPGPAWYDRLLSGLVAVGYTPVVIDREFDGHWDQGGCVNLSGKADIPSLFAILEQCAAVISGDTGPLHAANALGRPTIGLFGPVAPELRVRDQPNCQVLTGNEAAGCSACNDHQLHQCEAEHPACLEMIRTEDVVELVKDVC